MADSERITLPVYVPSVLAIGCPPVLLHRCEEAAWGLGLVLKAVSLELAAAAVVARSPLVLVVPNAVYALAGADVDALVCLSGAGLVRVEADVRGHELARALESTLRTRLGARDRRSDVGVYSMIGGLPEEAPLSPRSTPERPSTPARPTTADARVHCDLDALVDEDE